MSKTEEDLETTINNEAGFLFSEFKKTSIKDQIPHSGSDSTEEPDSPIDIKSGVNEVCAKRSNIHKLTSDEFEQE